MKKLIKTLIVPAMALVFMQAAFLMQPACAEKLSPFSLKGIDGKQYNVSSLKGCPLFILYFFDPDSMPCQEGIIWLSNMKEKYKGMDVRIWAVTTAPAEKARGFCRKTGAKFPVLLDNAGISALYKADVILPTVLIVGPSFQIMDKLQGGGKGLEVMVVRIAERELQRKNFQVAEKLGREVIKKNPSNVRAHVVTGYAELKTGRTEKAKKIFSTVAQKPGKGEILGTEGLAAVYAYKGDSQKAMELSDKVIKKAPKRAYPHVIKGNILYAKGKKKAAKHEFQAAVKSAKAEPFQQGVRFNRLGRLYASVGKYEEARKLYDQAVTIDPYYVEGMANKGVTYEKQGKWDKALSSYQKALKIDNRDAVSALLARKAEEMLELQRDAQRSKRIDRLVKELAQRYREQKKLPPPEDQWTSRPMVLTFLGFREQGTLPERDGLPLFFTSQLADYLNSSGRVKVVERVILDKLLQELNLGSSDLADRDTALRLGKILAAKLIGTGSFYYLPGSTLLSMRMIDTETSRISMVENRSIQSMSGMDRELLALNRNILKEVTEKYPLRGYIVQAEGTDRVMINIGSMQGVVLGTMFRVIEEGNPIVYKGRRLVGAPSVKGLIKVIKVEPGLSHAKILKAEKPLARDDKIEEIAGDGSSAI